MDVIKIFKNKWLRKAGTLAANPTRTKELLRYRLFTKRQDSDADNPSA